MRKLLLLLFYLIPFLLPAQLDYVVVDSIQFSGNKKTKENTIRREMDFSEGDTIALADLPLRIKENRTRIINTTLFTIVKINIGEWKDNNHITITIKLQEQWYVFPFPIFALADRNFNVWWSEQNRSLNRVNMGLRLIHYNFTGRRDKMKLTAQFGYTQKYELDYRLPAFNRAQTLGFQTNLFYATNKETSYLTQDNKFLFHNEEEVQLRNIRLKLGLIYRPKLFIFHEWVAEYHDNRSSDSLAALNPDFFLDQRLRQRFVALGYSFIIDKRDLRDYPLRGMYLLSSFRKDGLGFFSDRDAMTLTTTYAKYFPVAKKWSVELILKAHFYFYRKQQPYYNSRSFGFKPDYLRGYELYVVDGMNFTYFKSSLRWELFNREMQVGKLIPIKQMRTVPMRLYLTLNSDIGYVDDPYYHEGNPFSNRRLWGGGLGLDIVAYHDKVLQIEYSFNHLLENGLFLHSKFTF